MNLQETIARISQSLQQGRFSSEATVSNGIVLPILRALQWDTDNTEIVIPEYPVSLGGTQGSG